MTSTLTTELPFDPTELATAKDRGAIADCHYSIAMQTRIGKLTIVATDRGLRAITWPNDRDNRVQLPPELISDPGHPTLTAARLQLEEYFEGQRMEFDLPLDLRGTDFQRSAWQALASIPYGTTASYGHQARRIGRPSAVRAVGAANGRNPISIVLPCHRVIGANGSLVGFAGGIETKRELLAFEKQVLSDRPNLA